MRGRRAARGAGDDMTERADQRTRPELHFAAAHARNSHMSAIRVAVGSLNPVKVGAVRAAIERSALRPASRCWALTCRAACQTSLGRPRDAAGRNRARSAAPTLSAAHGAWPDYAVGLEGGVCEENLAAEHPGVAGLAPVLQCSAWMACYRRRRCKDGRRGASRAPAASRCRRASSRSCAAGWSSATRTTRSSTT